MMDSLLESFNASGRPDLNDIRNQLMGAARALVATGHLPADAVHDALAEFDELLEDRGMLRRIQQSVYEGRTLTAVRADSHEPPSSEASEPAQLLRVIPINERFAEFEGFVVTAVSMELWSAHVAFRYAVQGGDMRRLLGAGARHSWRWEANDDLGTVYRQAGASAGSGGTGGLVGQVNFSGPVPRGAERIAIRLWFEKQGPASVLVELYDDR